MRHPMLALCNDLANRSATARESHLVTKLMAWSRVSRAASVVMLSSPILVQPLEELLVVAAASAELAQSLLRAVPHTERLQIQTKHHRMAFASMMC